MPHAHKPEYIPSRLLDWLYDNGSLTERIQKACHGKSFHIKVLSQAYGAPCTQEKHKLNLSNEETALLREVHLMCENTAWVYARSVIPTSTLGGKRNYLANLGEQPLGAALFADPGMRREAIEIIKIENPSMLILGGQTPDEPTLWGRQSVFYLENNPLLVAEYFLPAIPAAPKSNN